eukprot:Skav219649  [mRNA]  locus=scaffold628:383602:388556:+ [translate_table: standard]
MFSLLSSKRSFLLAALLQLRSQLRCFFCSPCSRGLRILQLLGKLHNLLFQAAGLPLQNSDFLLKPVPLTTKHGHRCHPFRGGLCLALPLMRTLHRGLQPSRELGDFTFQDVQLIQESLFLLSNPLSLFFNFLLLCFHPLFLLVELLLCNGQLFNLIVAGL